MYYDIIIFVYVYYENFMILRIVIPAQGPRVSKSSECYSDMEDDGEDASVSLALWLK